MIVVNLNKSYPLVAARLAEESKEPSAYLVQDFNHAGLSQATCGDWYRLSDNKIEAFGDVLLGTYDGLVVSAYRVTYWTQNDNGTVTFTGAAGTEWTPILGTPQPGGPWRQGEARGTRYVPTVKHTNYREPGAKLRDWRLKTAQIALSTAWSQQVGVDVPPTSAEHLVEAHWASDGTLEITIPDNTPHRIITRSAQHHEQLRQALAILGLPDTPENRASLQQLRSTSSDTENP